MRHERALVWQQGQRLRLLFGGADYFALLLAEIDAAREEVLLESYLFGLDSLGERVVHALISAAQRGVRVRLLLDGFGTRDFPPLWRDALLDAGVQCLQFRPEVGRWRLSRTRLRRLHRKLAVIDARVAFVGGINLLDDREPDRPDLAPRYDYALRVEGPLVARMHDACDRLWRHRAWLQLKPDWTRPSTLTAWPEAAGTQRAAFAVRDNVRHRRSIEEAYLAAIARARDEIVIANAYFLPGRTFRRALAAAAARGVRVVLVLQGQIDHPWLHWASRVYFRDWLSDGFELFEYTSGFMHAKAAVIDRHWATVGSSNLDPFSLLLAREANVFVDDPELACALRDDIYRQALLNGRPVNEQTLRRRRWPARVASACAYALARVALAISGAASARYLD
ncbi:cardiolipin synthase ClsB [Chitinibacteraceae bacterium HSL-7]